MKIVDGLHSPEILGEVVEIIRKSRNGAALTGAGISVGSGIPDFRSPGGLWTKFSPGEYATLEVFQRNPVKAWQLYREMGRVLEGKRPNRAHYALAELETGGNLNGVITQNVDGLHQQAGNRTVLEIHGDHQSLQCLKCGHLEQVQERHIDGDEVPCCLSCQYPLKPNVVLFGEAVRNMEGIDVLIRDCDLLLVIGTSAQVYPAAGLPHEVKRNGGTILEFNREQALGSGGFSGIGSLTDYFFRGDVEQTLPALAAAMSEARS